MRKRTAEQLAKLYPRAWRARFSAEFVDILEAEPIGLRILLDVVRAAAAERLLNLSGLETHTMHAYSDRVIRLAGQPSGFVPMLMSLTALAIVVGAVTAMGGVRQSDEGAAAHIFQLLIAGELPLLALFAMRWLRKDLKAACTILVAQAAAIGVAFFPVWYFHL